MKIGLDLESPLLTLIPIVVVVFIFLEGEGAVFGLRLLDQMVQERPEATRGVEQRSALHTGSPGPRSDCPPPDKKKGRGQTED